MNTFNFACCHVKDVQKSTVLSDNSASTIFSKIQHTATVTFVTSLYRLRNKTLGDAVTGKQSVPEWYDVVA